MSDKNRNNPSPKAIAREALSRLGAMADPEKAAGGQKYFKDSVKLYGVRAPDVRGLAAELFASVRKRWTVGEAVELCDILFPEAELEAKAVGELVLSRFKNDFPKSLFGKAKAWLAADLLDNWASTDLFCTDAMGALLLKYRDLVPKIKDWARHRNLWVRRASAVSFIKLAKHEEFLPSIYDIAVSLFPDRNDLIHKATGWLLREAGKCDARRLEKFLLGHGPAVPRTALRYAIERFPEEKRRAILEKTKPAKGRK